MNKVSLGAASGESSEECAKRDGRIHRPSPAVAFVGRHNSGKTTLLVRVIAELVSRGFDIGSIKHHGHCDFDIDVPGKDSYRHREAGSRDVVVVSPTRMARITELNHEIECDDIVSSMPDHDLVIVEGFRQSGLDVIEVLRSGNDRDLPAAEEYCEIGTVRGVTPVAVVSNMESVHAAAKRRGTPSFSLEDIEGIADFLQAVYVRPKLTVAIQAGGESRRMGQSKATVPFLGEPLLTRIVERIACAADELVVTTNEASRLGFLGDLDIPCPLKLVPDSFFKGWPRRLERRPIRLLPSLHAIWCSLRRNWRLPRRPWRIPNALMPWFHAINMDMSHFMRCIVRIPAWRQRMKRSAAVAFVQRTFSIW